MTLTSNGGRCPPAPPEIYRFGANPAEQLLQKKAVGTVIDGRPFCGIWPLSRRSGRVSALPCPPLRTETILQKRQP